MAGDFAAYGHALVSMVLVAVIAMLLAPMSALRKSRDGLVAGSLPEPDYASATYRYSRAHLNATENVGVFSTVCVAAILSGAAPFWVNLLASVYLVSRVIHVVVHLGGIGKESFGIRTYAFVFGTMACGLLALLAIGSVFL